MLKRLERHRSTDREAEYTIWFEYHEDVSNDMILLNLLWANDDLEHDDQVLTSDCPNFVAVYQPDQRGVKGFRRKIQYFYIKLGMLPQRR